MHQRRMTVDIDFEVAWKTNCGDISKRKQLTRFSNPKKFIYIYRLIYYCVNSLQQIVIVLLLTVCFSACKNVISHFQRF